MSRRGRKLDDAARAAWLYYVGGMRQDQIADEMGVSRQTAQRLVAQAMSEGLVRVRVDHPFAICMELAAQLKEKWNLSLAEVSPSVGGAAAVAMATADSIERWLTQTDSVTLAIGTGSSLRAAVEELPHIDCPQHRVVSLTGNIAPDGSATYNNVLFTLSDVVTAKAYPLPIPVIARTRAERDMLHSQPGVQRAIAASSAACVAYVGIGAIGAGAPLVLDGFLTAAEIDALQAAGGVGEILGRAHDHVGREVIVTTSERVASAPLPATESCLVIGVAYGRDKLQAIAGALRGGLISGLITDEPTAQQLLALPTGI